MSANHTPARKWSEEHRPASPEVDALEAEYASKMTTRLRIFALARKLEAERDALRERVDELVQALGWILQADRGSRAFESALSSARVVLSKVGK